MSEDQNDAVTADPPEELRETAGEAPASAPSGGGGSIDLELLMDVQVTMSVEIGRTRLTIKELLALNQGSIVSLDRGINEPLDLMVNGTLIARGEVVEADGQFGLKLLDVVSPGERLKKLK